jgi:hypothetical protein
MVAVDFGVASEHSMCTDPRVYIHIYIYAWSFHTQIHATPIVPTNKVKKYKKVCRFSAACFTFDCELLATQNCSSQHPLCRNRATLCSKMHMVAMRDTPNAHAATHVKHTCVAFSRVPANNVFYRARGLPFWSSSSGVSLSLRRLYRA